MIGVIFSFSRPLELGGDDICDAGLGQRRGKPRRALLSGRGQRRIVAEHRVRPSRRRRRGGVGALGVAHEKNHLLRRRQAHAGDQ
jgi:hypothetical protein